MNKWVKRKWLCALRSGEYVQGQGYLVIQRANGEAYQCCLGVLACEMAPEFVHMGEGSGVAEVEGATDMLADDLAIMFDLDWDSQDVLANMNDGGDDFLTIADWIETNL